MRDYTIFTPEAKKLLTELKQVLHNEMIERGMRTADTEVAIVQYITNSDQPIDGLAGPNTLMYAVRWIWDMRRI